MIDRKLPWGIAAFMGIDIISIIFFPYIIIYGIISELKPRKF